jgi:hypothetical protein
MHFENIPRTEVDFKKKEKEWQGFEHALKRIGLDKRKTLDNLKKGLFIYQDKRAQEHRCKVEYENLKKTLKKDEEKQQK